MAGLLDLTVQGDVATISDESKLPQIKPEFAFRALSRRLKVIGIGLPGPPVKARRRGLARSRSEPS